jgi:hypothetical protein
MGILFPQRGARRPPDSRRDGSATLLNAERQAQAGRQFLLNEFQGHDKWDRKE